MNFVHSHEYLNRGDVVVVDCDHQCNVRLMDDSNFSRFRQGQEHQYYGGFYKRLPAQITVPGTGHWNVTIDLGGGQAKIKYDIKIIKAA